MSWGDFWEARDKKRWSLGNTLLNSLVPEEAATQVNGLDKKAKQA